MVINLRGTGGSGKSTVVRRIMELYSDIQPRSIKDVATDLDTLVGTRNHPIGYECSPPIGENEDGYAIFTLPQLFVVGHYEAACGGCDTIKKSHDSSKPGNLDYIYSLIESYHTDGFHVICEGIILQDDTKRAIEFNRKYPGVLRVLGLKTPLETCLAGIQARRDARGDTRPLNPKNTANRFKSVKSRMEVLKFNNIDARWVDREEAFNVAKETFGW